MPNPYSELGEAIADQIWIAELSEEGLEEWIDSARVDAWASAKVRLGDPIPDILSTMYVLQHGTTAAPMISLIRRTEVDQGTVLLRISRRDTTHVRHLWAPRLASNMDAFGAVVDAQTQELEDVWENSREV